VVPRSTDPAEILSTITHEVLEERAVVDDPKWDTLTVLATVTPEMVGMTAYRYTHAGPGLPTPLRGTDLQRFRDLRAATAAPDGTRWEMCIIKIDRDSARVAVNFVYGDQADQFRITPDSVREVTERLRPQPTDFG
jgi:hypothetical protein